jgi:glycosyltransferase involved in cell wall biosynthesis
MPRLLILCEYPTLLGGERSMLATLSAIAAAGFEITVAAPPDGALAAELRARDIRRLAWRTHDEFGERIPLDRLRDDLADIVRRNHPDLLHANSLSTARIAGPVAANNKLRSVGHLRDIVKLSGQAIQDINAHRKLIAVSHATRGFHLAQGLNAEQCVVVHNGVNLTEFHPGAPTGYLHRQLCVPPATRFVAVIGQLGLRKATDVALTAAREIADQTPDVHWLVVGERSSNKTESREFEARLKSIAAEQPLAGRVHFLGNRRDVAQLLRECSVLVHAARQEPLGRVLLEAAACGLAVVATDVGGTREIFPTEADGAFLVPPDHHNALASAVLALLQDDRRRRLLGAAARLRAEGAFDIRTAASRLIEQFQETLA